jgi:hypothetical protein
MEEVGAMMNNYTVVDFAALNMRLVPIFRFVVVPTPCAPQLSPNNTDL